MTRLYQDPCFLLHATGRHPERPQRLAAIADHFAESQQPTKCQVAPGWQAATLEQLARVHQLEYVEAVREYAAQGGGQMEADTVVCPQSYDVAIHATGAVCDATEQVLGGAARNALCLVRPPGHHALANGAMGFCLFNSIAVAARHAIQALQLDRVLVIDWDVHHGNGTQDTFWSDEQVGFFSIHRWPFYPGTGDRHETGTGPGLGTTCNLPLTLGISRQEYLQAFETELTTFAAKIKPQCVLLSAGFDSHRQDPIGSLGLETEDFATLTDIVLQVAEAYCGGHIVSVLEGGYNVDVLPYCIEQHLDALLQASENPPHA